MKNFSYKLITLCFLMLAASCEVIDQDPISEFTQESFWKSEAEVNAAVIAMYDGLQGALGSANSNVVNYGDMRADLYTLGGNRTNQDLSNTLLNQLISSNSYVAWDDFYRTILRANLVIKNVPGVTDPAVSAGEKERALGEAYFIRALCYFYLVRVWGDVPYHAQPIENPNSEFKLPKMPREQVLDSIETDLSRAVGRVSPSTGTSIRASRGAVRALLTDVYLWRGKNQQAADTALAVMQTSGYSLASSFQQLFNAVPPFPNMNIAPVRNHNELIFQLQYGNLQQESNQMTRLYLLTAWGGSDFLWIAPSLVNQFEPNDQRAVSTFSGTQIIKYYGSQEGTSDRRRVSDNNIFIYRLADVITMRAEALAKLGDLEGAITELTKVRNRAFRPATGSPFTPPPLQLTTQQEVLDAILLERKKEFVGEGKRWFDLVRNNKALGNPNITGLDNENEFLWPVSDDEIRIHNDPSFQNPGY